MKKVTSKWPFKGLVVATVLLLIWAGIRYFDRTQESARRFLVNEPRLTAQLGSVQDVILYKLRYVQPEGARHGCFAEYYFL